MVTATPPVRRHLDVGRRDDRAVVEVRPPWSRLGRDQAGRPVRWPGAARKPTDLSDGSEPFELELGDGIAEIRQLPQERGYVWEATGADGTSGQAEEPYASRTEAAPYAGAFLAQHAAAADPEEAHADCVEPHRAADGEYVDCNGTPR
ncbi:hypothetical protein [Streptomyces sp. NPDC047009]|uniref:hypothetical protein n=1 Tax=Streptomyces sp. NPDC047009 TaxID=3154496 RepID=UPI0033C28C47